MMSSESCCVICCISDLVSFWCLNFLDLISKAIFCSLFFYRLCCCLLRASKSLLCSRCTVRISWIPVSLNPATQTAAIERINMMQSPNWSWTSIQMLLNGWSLNWVASDTYSAINLIPFMQQVQSEWNAACSRQSIGLAQPSQVSEFINVG